MVKKLKVLNIFTKITLNLKIFSWLSLEGIFVFFKFSSKSLASASMIVSPCNERPVSMNLEIDKSLRFSSKFSIVRKKQSALLLGSFTVRIPSNISISVT